MALSFVSLESKWEDAKKNFREKYQTNPLKMREHNTCLAASTVIGDSYIIITQF